MVKRPGAVAHAANSTALGQLVAALERAGVCGRGGANFPAATKLAAVAAHPGRPIVVVNAVEGEPLSHKDGYLLGTRAGTVLDGAFAVANALDAQEIVIAIDERLREQAGLLSAMLQSRAAQSPQAFKTSVQLLAGGYVTGQETALLAALAGRAAKPTLTPPYPFERGLRGRPTFVSNIETYSQIGRVSVGTYDGTRLLTVSGAVKRTGVFDVGPLTTLEQLLTSAGAAPANAPGVLLGGYSGTWARVADVLGLALDERAMCEHGLTLGTGIVFLLSSSACPVAEVARVTDWMAGQSTKQCGPCVHGLRAIAGALGELTRPGAHRQQPQQVARWTAMVKGRGACAHPDGVWRFVTTAMKTFEAEFERHARYGACERCGSSRELPAGLASRSRHSRAGAAHPGVLAQAAFS